MARILILEDNDDPRGWYARELEADGHEVFQAARVEDAGDELESGALDFVVMDITQQPMDKAHDLMQILLRDGSTHVVVNIGRDEEGGGGAWVATSPDLSRLKKRIQEMLPPSRLPGQGTAPFC